MPESQINNLYTTWATEPLNLAFFDANNKRPVSFYEVLFCVTRRTTQTNFSKTQIQVQTSGLTVVKFSFTLFPLVSFCRTRGALRPHTLLHYSGCSLTLVFLSDGGNTTFMLSACCLNFSKLHTGNRTCLHCGHS